MLVPHTHSSHHMVPSMDAMRTAVRLGRLARRAYDYASEYMSSPNQNPPSSPPNLPSAGRGGGSVRGRGSEWNTVNKSDLIVRPPSNSIPNRVPRSVSNQVFWDVVKSRATVTVSTSAITELNYSAALSAHPQASSFQAIFDQFCIPQFSVTWYNTTPPGGGQSEPILHTALDFDNIANLGSIANIDDYATCMVKNFPTGSSFTRSVQPCVKPTINATSSAGVTKMWLDCSTASSVAHTGIRSIWETIQGSTSLVVVYEITIWFCFRSIV
jgi:hypothetical protein